MSAAPSERWRQRLHEAFRLTETLAEGQTDPARRRDRLQRAERLRDAARRRDATFGADLFAEPAFDLLLDLYIAERSDDGTVPPDHLPGGPPGAGWRYVAVMERRGLVTRHGGERLRLTPEATEAMERYLDAL